MAKFQLFDLFLLFIFCIFVTFSNFHIFQHKISKNTSFIMPFQSTLPSNITGKSLKAVVNLRCLAGVVLPHNLLARLFSIYMLRMPAASYKTHNVKWYFLPMRYATISNMLLLYVSTRGFNGIHWCGEQLYNVQ